MKRFVRNDNRLYNITKQQNTFLYIMTGYTKVTRVLQVIINDCKLVTTLFPPILLENISMIYTSLTGIYTYKGAAK